MNKSLCTINYFNLRQFSKYLAESVLRSLRSKEVQGKTFTEIWDCKRHLLDSLGLIRDYRGSPTSTIFIAIGIKSVLVEFSIIGYVLKFILLSGSY